MTYAAKVICDSIAHGVRLTTLEIVFPRFILAEFNTHRVFSRNSASSRAIPVERRLAQIQANPFVPDAFGRNKRGMQAGDDLAADENEQAQRFWLEACELMIASSKKFLELKVHKQWTNRLLENWAWHTVVLTSTEWENWDNLRDNGQASPEIQRIAQLMKVARAESEPRELVRGEWHLPYVCEDDHEEMDKQAASIAGSMQLSNVVPAWRLAALSSARCAAVSYERQALKDFPKDMERFKTLSTFGHMSPLEHPAQVDRPSPEAHFWGGTNVCYRCGVNDDLAIGSASAQPCPAPWFYGNFRAPWKQLRKQIPGEAVFQAR